MIIDQKRLGKLVQEIYREYVEKEGRRGKNRGGKEIKRND